MKKPLKLSPEALKTLQQIEQLAKAGPRVVQVRSKTGTTRIRLEAVRNEQDYN